MEGYLKRMQTSDSPVAILARTEPAPASICMGTGAMPIGYSANPSRV